MVVSRIQGGLGNQMFQYAFGLHLAERFNQELVLECSALQTDKQRSYALDRWMIDTRQATAAEFQRIPRRYGGKGYKNYLFGKSPLKWIREKPFGFQPKFLTRGKNVYLDGYWQSEQFFPGYREKLQSIFQPSQSMSRNTSEVARKMEAANSISLHIRRGDYVHSQVAFETHGVCPLSYYQTCIDSLLSQHEALQLFVFSDDPDWCKHNLNLDCPTTYVDHNSTDEAHEDLWLMTRCRHHIVANSSFSWWGAWLREDQAGQVFAPKRWFADQQLNSSNVVPPTWKKVAVADSTLTQAA